MSKTSVDVDPDIARQAATILGTRTLRETIDAALREVVNAKRRLELIALLSEAGRFDFDAAEQAWGADGQVARTRYLADTSVFARLTKPAVVATFAPLAAEGLVGLCAPVSFELGFAARSPGDYQAMAERLSSYPPVPTTHADHRRALEVQAALAASSRHRALSLVDGLVAAIAEARDLIVLHYDADFELVAEVTGQPQQWIVPRGSAD